MRERELRLALVFYGGVSLAVYMHGVAKEIWKLARASRAWSERDPSRLQDSERVYFDLLAEVGRTMDLAVVPDIIAGSSAGGINSVFLAQAIATGQDFGCLTDLWLSGADIDVLLDPEAAPSSRWSKVYAEPLLWFAGRRYHQLFDRVEPATREEVRHKLSRLVRSRWFEPPFSGPNFTGLLLDGLLRMHASPGGEALVPPGLPLDLFVTVTDFTGHPERLRLHSPPQVIETEHRLVLAFHSSGHECDRRLGAIPELTLAARATASLPGAFPAFRLPELEAALAERGVSWESRDSFLGRTFPGRAAAGEDLSALTLIDGGVLDNAPFQPAIAALRGRPANREVDRRFLFVDPTPGKGVIRLRRDGGERSPGFFTTLLRSLSDLPREQPIRDSVDQLHALGRRARRLRYVIDGMRPAVEAAIARTFGEDCFGMPLTAARLSELRAMAHVAASRESGFTYPAYGQFKLSGVVEAAAELIVALGRHEEDPRGPEQVRDAVWALVRRNGITEVDTPWAAPGEAAPYVAFLRRFDLAFRVRRLRALIRALSDAAARGAGPVDRDALEAAQASIYQLLALFSSRGKADWFTAEVRLAAADAVRNPAAALAALGEAWGLSAADAQTDARLAQLFGTLDPPLRRAALSAYLGFPFFDVATLALHQDDGLLESDEIKVDRIAPEDTRFLRDGTDTLKGAQMASFGAFFARGWRENDYLWGRLHAVERLVDIVLSTLPLARRPGPAVVDALKARAIAAILEEEEPRLTAIPATLAEIAAALAQVRLAAPPRETARAL